MTEGFERLPVGVRGWWADAACTPADAESLFSEVPAIQRRAVETICKGRRCPVVAQCKAAGDSETWGAWGAQTDRTRWRLRGVEAQRRASA